MIYSFMTRPPFSGDILNILLIIRVLRNALPWGQFQEPTLCEAFHLTHSEADLRSPTWVAGIAQQLHFSIYDQLISQIKVSLHFFSPFGCNLIIVLGVFCKMSVSKSKICLVHNGWKTKGNHSAFIGVTATWIN